MYEIILIEDDKANFRVLKQNIRVLDKYWCIGQNPWVLDQIFGSLNKSLVLDIQTLRSFVDLVFGRVIRHCFYVPRAT